MTFRYAKLKRAWLLRGWKDVPWAAVNWRDGDFRELGEESFYVAQSCDGRTDFNSMAFLPRHLTILDKLIQEGIAEECRHGDLLESGQEFRTADNPVLRGITWSITGRCNMNCRHCFVEAPSGRFGDFSTEQLWNLIDQFERANVPEVALTGGEPFMREELPEVVERLTNKKIGVAEIFTNGLLIDETNLDIFRKFGHQPLFKISFDGCGRHDYMRGTKGVEKKVIEAIRRVRDGGFPVTAITSVDQVSRDSLDETYKLMKEIGIDGWWLAPPVEIGNWRGSTTGLPVSEMVDLCVPLLRRWIADGRPFKLKLWRFGLFTQEGEASIDQGCQPQPQVFGPDSWNCDGTHSRPYMLPDGTLIPCSGFTGTSLMAQMPNLLEQDLTQAWNHVLLRSICDLKKRDVLARNRECSKCEFFGDCGAGCRVFALIQKGDLMSKDPMACDLFRKGHIRRFREMARKDRGDT